MTPPAIRFRVACEDYATPARTNLEDIQRRLRGIQKHGACDNRHRIELSEDGGRTWKEISPQDLTRLAAGPKMNT